MAGIYDIGGERLTNVADPTNPDHAATKRYVDNAGGTQATLALSAAQLRTITATPIQIVAAPVAGYAIWPIDWFLQYTFGTYPYAGSPKVCVGYAGDTTEILKAQMQYFTSENLVAVDAPSESTSLYANANGGAMVIFGSGGSFSVGPVATAVKAAGGSGYAPGDTGFIDAGNGDATYVIDTVGGGGAVLTFHLTDVGTGYAATNGVATGASSGVGTGFTVNVTVNRGDGSIKITLRYITIAL